MDQKETLLDGIFNIVGSMVTLCILIFIFKAMSPAPARPEIEKLINQFAAGDTNVTYTAMTAESYPTISYVNNGEKLTVVMNYLERYSLNNAISQREVVLEQAKLNKIKQALSEKRPEVEK
ncbi:hypothetical protein KBA63_04135 [Candidatus Woesebacteria bacterium]|nr:hypothetical protein [Candidatus Woesebacteria bacterium]